ncbi:transglycosylase SLT domain-containing protein [Brevundimonas sp. BAL450]|uniref:transglycosylase SLT domain-containing protein n=1 Tax=Brevundimonas sp. BAL450 TaxID=1708162 RepID=UPI0018CB8A3E|nr:transglycosylase SLT domain-containing protein [Brevundimonas sp. BAL450]MBG7616465.1 transglycosylase SLT domain-containing protein [Brevundimonas sp. BAL450]
MAIGTGLPQSRGAAITTLTDMRSFGAGERATADALGQVAGAIDEINQVLEPSARLEAQRRAQTEMAEGRYNQRAVLTQSDADYNAIMREGTLARMATQADGDMDALEVEHRYDPEAYSRAAAEYRAGLVGNAPADLAPVLAQSFDRESTQRLGRVRNRRAEQDVREAGSQLESRAARLSQDIIGELGEQGLAGLSPEGPNAGRLSELRDVFSAMVANPALAISPEEALLRYDAEVGRIKAAAVAGQAVGILREGGYEAALEFIQTIPTDESLPLNEMERQGAFEAARLRVGQEQGITQERENAERQTRARAEQDMARRIEDAVGQVAFTGVEADISLEEVREIGGDDLALTYVRQLADAREFHNQVGNLAELPPEEAARRIAQWQTRQSSGGQLPAAVGSPEDFESLVAAVTQVETGGNPFQVSRDPDGAGPAGGGAVGAMQLLPATAERMAERLGLPFDRNRLLNDVAYNQRLGREYLRTLMDRYGGDARLAVTAYHAGEGNVDGWLESVGDPRSGEIGWDAWLNGVEGRGNPRSAEYPRRVAAAMGGGRSAAAWNALEQAQSIRRTDPASAVAQQIDVSSAREAFMADPSRGYDFVQANLSAQERAGIASRERRPIPNEVAMPYVRVMQRAQAEGNTVLFNEMRDTILQQYRQPGRTSGHGEAVLAQVLTMAGSTQFAAEVSAELAGVSARGGQPTQAQARQVPAAARQQAMTNGAQGRAAPPVQVSSESEFANLPSGTRFIAPDGSIRVKP